MTFPMHGSVRAPGFLELDRAAVLGEASRHAAVIVHHVPGRLLDALCGQLDALPGVRSATSNGITGSAVINYDPSVLRPDALCAALRGYGFSLTENEEAARMPSREGFLGRLVEAVLERLAIAMIAAVV